MADAAAPTAKLSDFGLLCFDIYGTLVDWEAGILAALQPLLDAHGAGDRFTPAHLLAVYHELEAAQQAATPDLAYDALLTAVHPQMAARLGLPAPGADASAAFGASVGRWPAFPDTVAALRRLRAHYKLAVLSNVDRASFAATNAGPLAGVPFDLVVTAQDVGSYKPDPRNFEHMLARVEADFGLAPARVLQTAQSQFHDHHPARRAGIRSCWIVRPGAVMGNRGDEVFDWKFDTLGDMADALDRELAAEGK